MVGITLAPVFNFIQTSDIWTFLHSTIVSIISEYMKQVNASIWDSSLWKWSRSRLPFHNICKTVLMRMRCFLLVYFTTSSIALFCFFFSSQNLYVRIFWIGSYPTISMIIIDSYFLHYLLQYSGLKISSGHQTISGKNRVIPKEGCLTMDTVVWHKSFKKS